MTFVSTCTRRPPARCLTTCTYCQPASGRFRLGGNPLPFSGGTRAPGLDHRFTICALAVGGDCRRSLLVATLFDLFHHFLGDLFFGLGDGTSDSEPGLGFDRRAAPEGPAFVFFWDPF